MVALRFVRSSPMYTAEELSSWAYELFLSLDLSSTIRPFVLRLASFTRTVRGWTLGLRGAASAWASATVEGSLLSSLGWGFGDGQPLCHPRKLEVGASDHCRASATVTLGVRGLRELPLAPVPPRRVAELRSTNRSHPSLSLTYSYNTCFQFGFVQYSGLFVQGRSRDPFGGIN